MASFLKVTHLEQDVCCGQYRKAGDVFLSAQSAVSLNWWIPSTKEAVCLRASISLGVAGPRVRSMGLNGSQKETVGCGGSFTPASSREWRQREGSLLYRKAEFYLLLSILTPSLPVISLFAHIQTVQIRKRGGKININMRITEHAQCGANPVTLSVSVIRGAERACCLDLWVSDRKEKVGTNQLKR